MSPILLLQLEHIIILCYLYLFQFTVLFGCIVLCITTCPLMCILNTTCTKQRLPSCRRKNKLSVCLASGIYRPAVTLLFLDNVNLIQIYGLSDYNKIYVLGVLISNILQNPLFLGRIIW